MSAEEKDEASAETAASAAPPKRGKRKLALAAVAAVVVLAGGGGAAFFMLGGDKHPAETKKEAHADASEEPPTYVDVPAMVVNLRTGGQPGFLKLHFVLVTSDEKQGEELKARLPSIIDALQPFLRELRPEDLAGAAAVYRMKEEMLARARSQAGEMVKDVLIQDLIQQ